MEHNDSPAGKLAHFTLFAIRRPAPIGTEWNRKTLPPPQCLAITPTTTTADAKKTSHVPKP